MDYYDDMANPPGAADLVIGRSGAVIVDDLAEEKERAGKLLRI
ncbi:MAG: hypothetical protein ACYS76_04825 [Planctomycetota bacterium]